MAVRPPPPNGTTRTGQVRRSSIGAELSRVTSVTILFAKDYRLWVASAENRTPNNLLDSSIWYLPFGQIQVSPHDFLVPSSPATLNRLSNAVTHTFRLQLPISQISLRYSGMMKCLHLPDRQGFVLHTVTRLHRSRVISTTCRSATLCPAPLRGYLFGSVL